MDRCCRISIRGKLGILGSMRKGPEEMKEEEEDVGEDEDVGGENGGNGGDLI